MEAGVMETAATGIPVLLGSALPGVEVLEALEEPETAEKPDETETAEPEIRLLPEFPEEPVPVTDVLPVE